MNEGSEMHEIVILGSLETESNDQSGPEDITRGEPRESTPILRALQVVRPLDQLESRPSNAKHALLMSAKLIYVLSSFHMLFCEFYIHLHVKIITFHLNLVL